MHGGAREGGARSAGLGRGDLGGLLDPESPGVRGESPATRDELAGLILRYRAEQASRQSRRRVEERWPRFTPEQRLLILDSWLRSKLPAGDFAPLVGLSLHTLRAWKQRFEERGPAGLDERRRGSVGQPAAGGDAAGDPVDEGAALDWASIAQRSGEDATEGSRRRLHRSVLGASR
jgi:transposase-like protein